MGRLRALGLDTVMLVR